MSRLGLLIAAFAAAASFVVLDDRAAATTFCVPNFSAACASGGGNVAEADLEKAMGLNSSDGVADTIIVAAGTRTEDASFEPSSGFKNPGTYEPAGSDALKIVGAGTGSTILTSGGTGNIFLVSLGAASGRKVTIEDLTLQVPTSFPDNEGSAIQLYNDDTLRNVEIVSLNDDSSAVSANGTGNLAVNTKVRGAGAGSIFYGFAASSDNADLAVEDSVVEGASWGLVASAKGAKLTARRVTELGIRTYGAVASAGTLEIENSRIVTADTTGLYVSAGSNDALLDADHVTVSNSGGSTDSALEATRLNASAGKATLNVSNSILRGFKNGYRIENKAASGPIVVNVRYSNFQNSGTNNAVSTSLDVGTGNIDADPLLQDGLSLAPNSPSIDKGDPGAGLLTDFLGAPRPNDGDWDGLAVRDQGAFEYQQPAPPDEDGGGGGGGTGGGSGGSGSGSTGAGAGAGGGGTAPALDTVAPVAKLLAGPGKGLAQGKAKFRFSAGEPGSRFECKLDRGKVRACSSPKLYTGLKPGRHSFKVWAIDAAGNRAAPLERRFRVPPA